MCKGAMAQSGVHKRNLQEMFIGGAVGELSCGRRIKDISEV